MSGSHDHGHGHHHNHSHAPTSFGMAFAVGTVLNVALVVIQVFYGILAHSTALLADAAHNSGDALGLLMAWSAHVLARNNDYCARQARWLGAVIHSETPNRNSGNVDGAFRART